jgi:hypothetical protein
VVKAIDKKWVGPNFGRFFSETHLVTLPLTVSFIAVTAVIYVLAERKNGTGSNYLGAKTSNKWNVMGITVVGVAVTKMHSLHFEAKTVTTDPFF